LGWSAHGQRESAQVLAVERHYVEGIELRLRILLAGVQGVEVGDAIDAKHHGLAIDHELPVPVLARCLDDPRVAVRPVVATARNQAHAFAVPLQPEAVAVVFDLMQPVRADRNTGRFGGKAKVEGAHGAA
jgi:hypothetical protein